MTQSHLLSRFCDALWLFPIQANGSSRLYGAEATTARADTPKNHEGGGFMAPAFANIGAARLLTDGVQLFTAHKLFQVIVVFALRWAHSQPFGTAFWNGGRHVGFLNRRRFPCCNFVILCGRLAGSRQLPRHPGCDGRRRGTGTSWNALQWHRLQ